MTGREDTLFTTLARFPLFSQVIKFNIPRSLIVTGEGGAETIACNNTIYIFSQGNNLDQHPPPPPTQKKEIFNLPSKTARVKILNYK